MDYIETNEVKYSEKIEILNVEDFDLLIKKFKINQIYIMKESNASTTKCISSYAELRQKLRINLDKSNTLCFFSFFHENILFQCLNYGYSKVEECLIGFQSGYKFKHISEESKLSGFDNFNDYFICRTSGFEDKESWIKSKEGGFPNYQIFKVANENGFTLFKEYEEASNLNIKKKEIFDIYKGLEIQQIEKDVASSDEVFILNILESLPPKEILALEKIWALFLEKKSEFTNNRYSWYKQSILSKELLEKFLENPTVKKVGNYDCNNLIFARKDEVVTRKKNIVLDGSNIAWGNGSRENGDCPKISNLVLMFNYLSKFNFDKITCFADANIEYIIDEKDILKKMIKKNEIQLIPANTDADIYIIEYAKENNCLIVTNDTFKKDYLQTNQWLRLNISDIRIPFIIKDNTVILGKSIS